ncbi:hypothetical protein QN386_13235 [Pseudomonas sp. CCI3.2]|uniref:hypothetical protein n=1 Tax=unclassified Pseudomonas TaxID=196821 RepID=UPI002AC909AD|nr:MULTISPECIES: hypothetical protein [unclassified Pseudomonas]MEB0079655.1 hypothetical protein [Pseudomonas sp. MH10out]MEB0093404.1 hypothetical protein [Pseudomonas sp. CCI4.2]MEB0102279.1 hypothetical protein [Pseudomonas sp. CCI3.2]MEB0129411.1 hypothetical protein [Pseudomonas sp. CCI2.4]MEB0160576.1 hypothetical protein [Pseudomonas sp. AH2 (2023)]
MKRTLAFGFALSVLAATSAFASPQTTTSVAKPVVAEATHVRVADNSAKTFDRLSSDLHGNVIVAENRKEFGSQYQRY